MIRKQKPDLVFSMSNAEMEGSPVLESIGVAAAGSYLCDSLTNSMPFEHSSFTHSTIS